MPTVRHLSKAPITEALIDLRIVPDGVVDEGALRGATETLRANYPTVVERKLGQIELQFGVSPTVRSSTGALHGIWLKSEDEKLVVQFRVDGFTFSRLRPYTSWDTILPEALRLWETYEGAVKPQGVSRVGVRYINHLPLRSTSLELDEYVVTGPNLPTNTTPDYSAFSSLVRLEDNARRCSAMVRQHLEPGIKTAAPTLLLDIDVFSTRRSVADTSDIRETLSTLRSFKNEVFFGTLTEEYVRVFV